MKPDPISWAFKKALKKLDKAEDNLDLLPPTVANFLLVHAAQGVIDNEGFTSRQTNWQEWYRPFPSKLHI